MAKDEQIKCIHCGSEDYTKRGFDPNDNSQAYRCKNCNKSFNHKAVQVVRLMKDILPIMDCDCHNPNMMMEFHLRDKFDVMCRSCNNVIRVDLEKVQQMIKEYDEECKESVDLSDPNDYNGDNLRGNIESVKQEVKHELEEYPTDRELIEESVRQAKKAQFYMDRNRKERKAFRLSARYENDVKEVYEDMIKYFNKGFELTPKSETDKVITIVGNKETPIGLIHLSDLHFNEIVNSVFGNEYSFKIASKRLKKYINKVKRYLAIENVKEVVVAMTGDLFNNNKISDKIMNQEYNRSYALLLGIDLLRQLLNDLLSDYKVTVASVVGNESRVDDVLGYSSVIVTDNFDFICHNILSEYFKDVKNIKFIGGRYDEKILCVGNTNVLMLHGNTVPTTDNHKAIQGIIGKYSSQGIRVDFVIYGHIHSPHLNFLACRSGSLPGSNNYSNNGLQLHGRASQNLHIIYSDASRDSILIDLQLTPDEDCYPLQNHLVEETKKIKVDLEDILIKI